MKRGYERLFIFEVVVFLFLIISTSISSFLFGYQLIIFLILLLFLFKKFFGFERDNHRYVKDFIMDISIFLIIFLSLYYLSGILFGFVKTNYLNIEGLTRFIIPTILYIVLKEFYRYNALCKSGNNKLIITIVTLLIIVMDISESFYYTSLTSNYNNFVYFAMYLLPAICNNIVFSYITTKVGYKPVMFYSLIIGLYPYLLPIVPNPSEYLQAMILFLLPTVLGYRTFKLLAKTKKVEIERDYYKKRHTIKSLIPLSISVFVIVYFISGYFNYWAIVIASGSMSDSINKGDIAIIHKVKQDYNKIEVGQVLAYEYENKIIVHRIVDKVLVDDKCYFSTKGDANYNVDNIIIEEDMIVGVVEFKIPLLGLPTVWLNKI